MELESLPKQYQLFYTISRKLFIEEEFKCIAILSKNPYLTALIACHGAKIDICPPYMSGTCILLPEKDRSKGYFHAVIDETVFFENEKFYYFRRYKPRANSALKPERQAWKSSYIESEGRVFPYQLEKEWLGKRNIIEEDLVNLTNSYFPVIIGRDAKSKIDYWKKIQLDIEPFPTVSMENLLNISTKSNTLNVLNVYTPQGFNKKKYKKQIWVNEVPENIEEGQYLIIISPFNCNFEDLISQINQFYAENRMNYIGSNDICEDLEKLGIKNKVFITATMMKEGVK